MEKVSNSNKQISTNNENNNKIPETVFNISSNSESHTNQTSNEINQNDINLKTDLESDEALDKILQSNLMNFPSNEKTKNQNSNSNDSNNSKSNDNKAKTKNKVEDDDEDDEHLWNAFNDVISQV